MSMRAAFLAACCVAVLAPVAAAADPLVADGQIPLPDTRGRIDHLAIDLSRQRLLVAALGNNTVDIVDLEKRSRAARLTGLSEPQGVGVTANADRYVVANAGDGSVRLFRADDLQPAGNLNLGSDADNVRVDPKAGDVLVGYGNGGIATINAATSQKTATVALPAHPEGFQLDPVTARIYINLPDAQQIAVADRLAGRVVSTWKTQGLSGNFPM